MVNFHDTSVVVKDSVALVKLWHVVCGLYIWEFLTTLHVEWSVIRGRRPCHRPILVYFMTRLATLTSVALCLVDLNALGHFNCQAVVLFQLIFGYLALATSSLLIVIRTVAIWNRNVIVVGIVVTAWMTNVAFLVRGITRIRGIPASVQETCMSTNIRSTKPAVIATLVTDFVLLLTMLAGLFSIRRDGGGRFGLGSFLWKQGVVWLLIATVAEVPPVVFLFLNLNDPFNTMFQFPALITMSIAATRMHRSLVDFGSGSSQICLFSIQESVARSGRTISKSHPTSAGGPIGPKLTEVVVHATHEQF